MFPLESRLLVTGVIMVVGLVATTVAVVGSAEDFCVSSAADLVDALDEASGNQEADVIRVVRGTYLTPGGPFTYFGIGEEFGLELLGGYSDGCTSRILDPTNTILDGQSSHQVVEITPVNVTFGDLLFQGFTVQNGSAPGFDPGGLSIGVSAGFYGTVSVEFNIFVGNHSATGAGN